MKPRFRIIPNPASVPTQMKIVRSPTRAGIETGTEIFSGAYSATYTDNAVTTPGNYWYQVSLSDDGTVFAPTPAFSMTYVAELGPCTEGLTAVFASVRRCTGRGTGRLGVMLGSLRVLSPTQAAASNWPAIAGAKGVQGTPVPPATATTWEPVAIDGVIHYLPLDVENLFRVGNTAVPLADALLTLADLRDSLETTSNNVYTVGGFQYRLVMLTADQVRLIGNSWLVNPGSSTVTHYVASTVNRTSTYFIDGSQIYSIDNTGATIAYPLVTAAIPALYVPMAFRLIGPA